MSNLRFTRESFASALVEARVDTLHANAIADAIFGCDGYYELASKLALAALSRVLAEPQTDDSVDDRDKAENELARVAAAIGLECEWSSCHYHGDCIIDAFEGMDELLAKGRAKAEPQTVTGAMVERWAIRVDGKLLASRWNTAEEALEGAATIHGATVCPVLEAALQSESPSGAPDAEPRKRRPPHKCPGPNCNRNVSDWVSDGIFRRYGLMPDNPNGEQPPKLTDRVRHIDDGCEGAILSWDSKTSEATVKFDDGSTLKCGTSVLRSVLPEPTSEADRAREDARQTACKRRLFGSMFPPESAFALGYTEGWDGATAYAQAQPDATPEL